MEKRTFWPFSAKNFPQDMNIPIEKIEVDHNITKMIYEHRFYGKPKEDPILHLKKYLIFIIGERRLKKLKFLMKSRNHYLT